MVIKSVNLETVCGVTSEFPDNQFGEVAFAGKSNVGKSSLINALMNRKALARISSQPGKTQTINFYNINENMYLVDLPGYGYANANNEIKAKWGQMIERYLHESKQLRAVFLLIDIRHDPSDNDRLMYDWMVEQGFAPIIIATKADKLKRSQIIRQVKAIEDGLNVMPDTIVIPTSAENKDGIEEIWELVESLVYTDEQRDAIARESAAKLEKEQAMKKKKDAIKNAKDNGGVMVVDGKARKPRWKDTDKPVAKKTADKNKAKKKAKEEKAKADNKAYNKKLNDQARNPKKPKNTKNYKRGKQR